MPYLTPDEVPEDDTCRPLFIPNDTAWLAIVSGALTELTKPWNWEQFGTLTVDEAVAASNAIVERYYAEACGGCELPDGGKIIGFDVDFRFQELVGETWQEPTGDYELPPIPEREEPTPEERRCIASANAANVLKLAYESMTDSYNLDLDPAVAFTAWVGTISTTVLVALGLLTFSTGTILFGLWTLAYQALEFLTEDVWGEGFENKLKCALFAVSEDNAGVVTFNYRAFLDNLAYNIDLFDPSLGELRLYAQIRYMLLFVGADGLNQFGATTGISEASCDDCEEGWRYCWDASNFSEWTPISYGGFTNQPSGILGASGWSSRWISVAPENAGNCHYDVVALELSFAESEVTTVRVLYDLLLGTENGGCRASQPIVSITLFDGIVQVGYAAGNPTSSGVDYLASWEGSAPVDRIQIRVNASFYRPSSGGSAGQAIITWVRIGGLLESPFPEPNCD